MLEEILTIEEVAAKLKVEVSWIYDQTRLDLIPHHRLGKRKGIRFFRPELEEWLKAKGSLKTKSFGKRKP